MRFYLWYSAFKSLNLSHKTLSCNNGLYIEHWRGIFLYPTVTVLGALWWILTRATVLEAFAKPRAPVTCCPLYHYRLLSHDHSSVGSLLHWSWLLRYHWLVLARGITRLISCLLGRVHGWLVLGWIPYLRWRVLLIWRRGWFSFHDLDSGSNQKSAVQ